MKIIHTADWHLGKVLHKQELYEEQRLFLEWLVSYIRTEEIGVMLVSGDIFDLANPSHKDLTLYYNFLQTVSETGIQMIITGGNHDSVSLLQTTQALLSARGIHVVGGLPDDRDKVIIPIYDHQNELQCIVLAIPFLRDRDLRLAESADTDTDPQEVIASSVRAIYQQAVEKAREMYGHPAPLIAMGHLYMQGSLTSESERDIHVGNLRGFTHALFPEEIAYFALGHIHKPQRLNKKETVRYSGSPVYLDFSESGYEKQFLLITIEEGDTSLVINPVAIPCFRMLLRWNGSLDQVKQSVRSFKNTCPLPAWAEISLLEETYSPDIIREMENLSDMPSAEVKIIKSRIDFIQRPSDENLWDESASIRDLKPAEVFQKKLETGVPEEDWELLHRCFAGILEDMQP